MQVRRLSKFSAVLVLCAVPLLYAQSDPVLLVSTDTKSANWDQTTPSQREPWNLGERQPNWTGSSTLTIENQCKSRHQFEVTPNNLPFVQIQAAQNIAVAGHQTKELPVKFDTTGITEGEHVGEVVVRCLDCSKEHGCTQDKEFIPVRMVIAKSAPASSKDEGTPPPPQQQSQSCGQSVDQPAPDLMALLNYKGYSARITELSPEAARQPQNFITGQPQFQTLMQELKKKGYTFPPGFAGARFATIDLKQGNCSTRLNVASFRSEAKPDGTMAGITVAHNPSAPEQSLFQVHLTNVYALQPEEMPASNPTIKFNNESWFTVQVGEAPPQQHVSAFWPVIWYRYWWYDSHRHANWFYGCYQWWWWRYHWYGRPWYWWYNWWWGYYYWWNWNYWSTWWAPIGPYQAYPPPE